MVVYGVWLKEWLECDRLLAVYFEKSEADSHKDRLDRMGVEFDECTYSVSEIEVE